MEMVCFSTVSRRSTKPRYRLGNVKEPTKEGIMATRSTIMDTNSFRPEMAAALDPETRKLTEERNVLGPAYRLFYRNPVHLVKGVGSHLWDADGEEYLDVYNNVASVGHCHPRVVEALSKQASMLNTHTRYLHENILHYAEDILSTMPDELDRIMFQCTGSEANDLAVRVAQTYTGGEGVIVTHEAYHGNSALTSKLSPALGTAQTLGLTMRMIPTPDTYRLEIDGKPASECTAEEFGNWMAGEVRKAVTDMERHGIKFAALLADSIFSSDGVYPDPVGYLKPVIDTVHELGGVWIADEVQPGFTRTGDAFWGFGRQGIVPDLVTSGKPMANGLPTSLMAARHEVLEPFAGSIPYFNTFAPWATPRKSARSSRTPSPPSCRSTPASATSVAQACTSAAKSSNPEPRIPTRRPRSTSSKP